MAAARAGPPAVVPAACADCEDLLRPSAGGDALGDAPHVRLLARDGDPLSGVAAAAADTLIDELPPAAPLLLAEGGVAAAERVLVELGEPTGLVTFDGLPTLLTPPMLRVGLQLEVILDKGVLVVRIKTSCRMRSYPAMKTLPLLSTAIPVGNAKLALVPEPPSPLKP